jgi:hypothetical protein
MNIPVFQWLMVAALTTFIPPADVAAVARRVRARLTGGPRPAVPAVPAGPARSEGALPRVARPEGGPPGVTCSEGVSPRHKSRRARRRGRR